MRGQGKREKMAMEERSGKVGQRKRKCARGGETREKREEDQTQDEEEVVEEQNRGG